jgi:hypothetical protein
MSALIYRVNFSFLVFFGQKRASFSKVIVKTTENSKNDPAKTFFCVKFSILFDFQHKILI